MTPEQVAQAKRNGAWLYSEHRESTKHVFPVIEWKQAWNDGGLHDPARRGDHTPDDDDTITLTRIQLGALLNQVVDMMACHTSVEVKLHLDILRCALSLPGALKQAAIAKKYGTTRDNICHMVRRKRAYTPSKGISLRPHMRRARGHPVEKKRD